MSEQHQPFLRRNELIPAFSLPGADGMPHSPWDYKQREHLAIILLTSFMSSEARSILQEFKQQYRTLKEESCAVLALATDTVIENLRAQEELQLPFALLADPRGEVIARFTYWEREARAVAPSLVLVNRYGVLYEQWIVEREMELPPITKVLNDLNYLNKLCVP